MLLTGTFQYGWKRYGAIGESGLVGGEYSGMNGWAPYDWAAAVAGDRARTPNTAMRATRDMVASFVSGCGVGVWFGGAGILARHASAGKNACPTKPTTPLLQSSIEKRRS